MEPDTTIIILALCMFVLMILVAIMRYMRLPPEHVETKRKRDEMRRMLVKKKVIPPELTKIQMAIEELNSRKK